MKMGRTILNAIRHSQLSDWLLGHASQPDRKRHGKYPDLERKAQEAAINREFGPEALEALSNDIQGVEMSEAERRQLLAQAWKDAAKPIVTRYLPVSLALQNALSRYINQTGLTLEEVDDDGAYTNLMKSAVIRDVQEGIIPALQHGDDLPFPMEEGEKLIWVMEGTEHHRTEPTEKTETAIHSLNLEVAPGALLGPESFPNRTVREQQVQYVDTGLLAFTDRHIHFAGLEEKFKIRYDEISPDHRPGHRQEDHKNFRFYRVDSPDNPQRFVTSDGIFAHVLAGHLEHRAREAKRES